MMDIGLLLMIGQVALLNVEEEHKLNKDNVFHQEKEEKLVWEKKYYKDHVMKVLVLVLTPLLLKFYL